MKALWYTCALVWCVLSAPGPLAAQEVIHALTGTVSSIDDAAKTITVFQDNGSKGVFKLMANQKTRISFDKRIAGETTAAEAFKNQGAYVIVFYFGGTDDRTVVALKSLGAGPFDSTEGTITNVNGHEHSISVVDKAGTVHKFKVDSQTVAEGNLGVVNGSKFDVDKGNHVRVVSTSGDGDSTALFVRNI